MFGDYTVKKERYYGKENLSEERMRKDTSYRQPLRDMVASGYEWVCPKCEKLCLEIEIPKTMTVYCEDCDIEYEVSNWEHATAW
jgi:uncharacterized protein (DUF983 family)